MPFHDPIPKPDEDSKKSSNLGSLVQAEKLMQIAFVLPCAMLLGWGAGWLIDHHFHTAWAAISGLIFGIIAGMVSVIRTAIATMNSMSPGKRK
jgi:F0F1-type ATP synthase assembly protein I